MIGPWCTLRVVPQSSNVVAFLEDCDVSVAETRQKSGAADAGGTASDESNTGLVRVWQFIELQTRVTDLRYPHFFEHLRHSQDVNAKTQPMCHSKVPRRNNKRTYAALDDNEC
jgi:hypothetical protein